MAAHRLKKASEQLARPYRLEQHLQPTEQECVRAPNRSAVSSPRYPRKQFRPRDPKLSPLLEVTMNNESPTILRPSNSLIPKSRSQAIPWDWYRQSNKSLEGLIHVADQSESNGVQSPEFLLPHLQPRSNRTPRLTGLFLLLSRNLTTYPRLRARVAVCALPLVRSAGIRSSKG